MAIRPQVQKLVEMGSFPDSADAVAEDIDRRGAVRKSIAPPVSTDEAFALLGCFGADDAFGLAWTLLHLIETAPEGMPISSKPAESENEWIRRLWDRSHR